METVTYTDQTVVYTYDNNGNRESVTYSTGVREEFRYDRDNKLLRLINSKADGSILSSFSYTYDLAGRQLTKQDSYGTSGYTYDAVGRILKEETPGRTAVYAYDNAGNRISLNETYTSEQPTGFIDSATGKEIKYILKKSEYIYSASNRLMKLAEKLCETSGKVLLTRTTVYIYDENGNQLRQSTSYTSLSSIKARQTLKGMAYSYSLNGAIDPLVNRTSNTFDGFNRLKKVEQIQSGVRTLVEYTYNGNDLRVSKTVRKSDSNYTPDVINYLYDRQHVILETGTDGNLKTRYIRGINYLARAGSSGQYSTILYNGHGDVIQTVDAAGNIENSYDYDIWGNPTLTLEQYSFSIRYAGEFFDKETGLYYLRARYYNPYIGRFISEDSYWGEDTNPLSLNLYTYCSNDPVQFTDPTGHWQQGDEKLDTQARVEISRLTDLYYSAKTKEEKKAASDAANKIRNNTANQTSTTQSGSTGAKVSNVLSTTSNKDSKGNAYMTADEWKSISQTKDDKVVVNALKDNKVTQTEVSKIASTINDIVLNKSYGAAPVNTNAAKKETYSAGKSVYTGTASYTNKGNLNQKNIPGDQNGNGVPDQYETKAMSKGGTLTNGTGKLPPWGYNGAPPAGWAQTATAQGTGKSNNSVDLSILGDPQALAKMDSFERADYFAKAYVSTDNKFIKAVAFTQLVLNFPAKFLEAYSASLKFVANNSMQGGYNNPEITDIMVDSYVYGMIPGEVAGGLVSSLRGVTGLTASAKEISNTVGVKNDLAKLQNLADQAAANVKAQGNAVFTQKQIQAMTRNPNLRSAFEGTAIDKEYKSLIAADKDLAATYNITKQGQWGPDLINKQTGEWVDITTNKQVQAHFDKYDPVFGQGMGYAVTYK